VLLLVSACGSSSPESPAAPVEDSATEIVDVATDTIASEVTSDTTTSETGASDVSSAKLPSDVLDLGNWKLTLPVDTDHPGKPDEITQPELATFVDAIHFHLDDTKTGVVFRAECGGVTTGGSSYPRSELREMTNDGKDNATWSSSSGTHVMTLREAVVHLPVVKADVVAAQIHDASDDVIEIRLRDALLFVEHNGTNYGTLNDAYVLGTPYDLEIRVTPGKLQVFYDGVQKVDRAVSGDGWYFRAGAYTQSNPSKGDDPAAYGEVVVYALKVSHA
jgi:poly(beta-D-mannuronate) lyase